MCPAPVEGTNEGPLHVGTRETRILDPRSRGGRGSPKNKGDISGPQTAATGKDHPEKHPNDRTEKHDEEWPHKHHKEQQEKQKITTPLPLDSQVYAVDPLQRPETKKLASAREGATGGAARQFKHTRGALRGAARAGLPSLTLQPGARSPILQSRSPSPLLQPRSPSPLQQRSSSPLQPGACFPTLQPRAASVAANLAAAACDPPRRPSFVGSGYFYSCAAKKSHSNLGSFVGGEDSNAPIAEVPLSMRFIHKPLRALEELTKASDPTRRNLVINAGLVDPHDLPVLPQVLPATPPHRLVRKKLGQVVKLLMKEQAVRRACSLPLTPTYKQVHFGGGPDVKYFSQADRPAAILTQNTPVASDDEDDDSTGEFDEIEVHALPPARTAPHGHSHAGDTRYPGVPRAVWEVEVLNFPGLSYHERVLVRRMPVFLESMFVLSDQRYLLGQVAVHNISYEKKVAVRYTQDSWTTAFEIPATYVPEGLRVLRNHNYDRFVFRIGLANLASVSGPMHYEMCVRFSVLGRDYWDNNGGANYDVRLERCAPQIPSSAKSPAPDHRARPKYSSSYLKRVNSDSSLPIEKKSASPARMTSPPQKFRDNFRDLNFGGHDYYLSSPLLTSLGTELLDTPRISGMRASLPSPSPSLRTRPRTGEPVSPPSELSSPAISPAPLIAQPVSSDIGSMSYKELLDSYCFFSAPSQESSATTILMSEEPNISYETHKLDRAANLPFTLGVTTDPDAPFTVSSFLRR